MEGSGAGVRTKREIKMRDVVYSTFRWVWYRPIYTVIITLAFLYQLNKGFSPLRVCVSSRSALPDMKSSCEYVRANRPVIAVYIGSITSKSVGKRMSK